MRGRWLLLPPPSCPRVSKTHVHLQKALVLNRHADQLRGKNMDHMQAIKMLQMIIMSLTYDAELEYRIHHVHE